MPLSPEKKQQLREALERWRALPDEEKFSPERLARWAANNHWVDKPHHAYDECLAWFQARFKEESDHPPPDPDG